MTGPGERQSKPEVYGSSTLVVDVSYAQREPEDIQHDDWTEDDVLETLLAEGDEYAVFTTDFNIYICIYICIYMCIYIYVYIYMLLVKCCNQMRI